MENTFQPYFKLEQEAKLHRGMCKKLARIVDKVVQIFPMLEKIRPGRSSGLKALSSFHLALERSKFLIHECAFSSKLYLAITGESIITKFEKVKTKFEENLKEFQSIVSESLGQQIAAVLSEISQVKFFLDPLEREIRSTMLSLLTQENGDFSAQSELFKDIAQTLGLVSPRSILEEQSALKALLVRSNKEKDKKKETILHFFMDLLRCYSKSVKGKVLSSETNSCMEANASSNLCMQYLSTSCPERFKHGTFMPSCSRNAHAIPEEFRCPISGRLMSEPVVIASGHTYERSCIEKWFKEGKTSCPKTKEKLTNLLMVQNDCIKSLISTWCQELCHSRRC